MTGLKHASRWPPQYINYLLILFFHQNNKILIQIIFIDLIYVLLYNRMIVIGLID